MTSIPANLAGSATRADEWSTPILARISWGPTLMGAVCAIGLQFIFTVLGIAVGVSAHDSTDTANASTVQTISIAAGLWWLITGTIALGVGGYVFGRLSGLPRSVPLKLEAAAMWGVVALFGFMVVWSGAGMFAQAASPLAMVTMSSGGPGAQATGNALSSSSTSHAGSPNTDSTARMVSAEEVRRATRTASWWSVVGLLAGLVASVAGACMGVPRDGRAHPH